MKFNNSICDKMADPIIVLSVAVLVKRLRRRRTTKRKHRFWVRKWLQHREQFGAYKQLMQEMILLDISRYRNFLRMDSSSFEELLNKVGQKITFRDTTMRNAIPAGERLAVTLRFLATGK